MNRTATFLAIATAALTLASAAGPVVDHADAKPQNLKQRCLTKGETVDRSGAYRLYVVEKKRGEQFYFACSTKIGVHVPVAEDCCDESGTPVATFKGDYAAIQNTSYGIDGEASSSLNVWNLRTGKSLGAAAVLSHEGLSDAISAAPVLLQTDGSLAWVGSASGDDDGPFTEVRAMKRGKAKTLDSGTGIDSKSLKVSGSAISWTKDGTPKSASF
jgi:hypothetical protein